MATWGIDPIRRPAAGKSARAVKRSSLPEPMGPTCRAVAGPPGIGRRSAIRASTICEAAACCERGELAACRRAMCIASVGTVPGGPPAMVANGTSTGAEAETEEAPSARPRAGSSAEAIMSGATSARRTSEPLGGAAGVGDDASSAGPGVNGFSMPEDKRGASRTAACASSGRSEVDIPTTWGAVGSPA